MSYMDEIIGWAMVTLSATGLFWGILKTALDNPDHDALD